MAEGASDWSLSHWSIEIRANEITPVTTKAWVKVDGGQLAGTKEQLCVHGRSTGLWTSSRWWQTLKGDLRASSASWNLAVWQENFYVHNNETASYLQLFYFASFWITLMIHPQSSVAQLHESHCLCEPSHLCWVLMKLIGFLKLYGGVSGGVMCVCQLFWGVFCVRQAW